MSLIESVKTKLKAQGRGAKVDLAHWLGVTPQHLHLWLSGTYKPNGEYHAMLTDWVCGTVDLDRETLDMLDDLRGSLSRAAFIHTLTRKAFIQKQTV